MKKTKIYWAKYGNDHYYFSLYKEYLKDDSWEHSDYIFYIDWETDRLDWFSDRLCIPKDRIEFIKVKEIIPFSGKKK